MNLGDGLEHITLVRLVEVRCYGITELNVNVLVLSHRDMRAMEKKDVSSHQDRVGEESQVVMDTRLLLVLGHGAEPLDETLGEEGSVFYRIWRKNTPVFNTVEGSRCMKP